MHFVTSTKGEVCICHPDNRRDLNIKIADPAFMSSRPALCLGGCESRDLNTKIGRTIQEDLSLHYRSSRDDKLRNPIIEIIAQCHPDNRRDLKTEISRNNKEDFSRHALLLNPALHFGRNDRLVYPVTSTKGEVLTSGLQNPHLCHPDNRRDLNIEFAKTTFHPNP